MVITSLLILSKINSSMIHYLGLLLMIGMMHSYHMHITLNLHSEPLFANVTRIHGALITISFKMSLQRVWPSILSSASMTPKWIIIVDTSRWKRMWFIWNKKNIAILISKMCSSQMTFLIHEQMMMGLEVMQY